MTDRTLAGHVTGSRETQIRRKWLDYEKIGRGKAADDTDQQAANN